MSEVNGLSLRDVFVLDAVTLRDVRALGGEVIEVPVQGDRHAPKYIDLLGEDLAQFMQNFTGRGYALTRPTMSAGETRYVREPGYESFGLKLFCDGNRLIIGRVAVLMDESIMQNYVRHLKGSGAPIPEAPKVEITLPDDWGFGSAEPAPAKDVTGPTGSTPSEKAPAVDPFPDFTLSSPKTEGGE